jgi:hypothetical protein
MATSTLIHKMAPSNHAARQALRAATRREPRLLGLRFDRVWKIRQQRAAARSGRLRHAAIKKNPFEKLTRALVTRQ